MLRFSSGEAFLRAKAPVDILFLDIRLGGMDGIETAKALRAQNSDMILIFLTGCREYALEAFDVSAFHYLLKPMEEQKFQDIFTKALAEAGKKNHREDGRLLLKSRGRHISLSRSDSRGGELFLFDLYPVLRLFVPILLLLSLVSVLYGVRLYQRMVVLRQDQSSRAVLEEQLKSMQEYLQEERRVQSGIRSMKHDMKNTVSVIMQLAKKIPENQNTELEQYLSELEQSLQELDYRFHTGSAVVDALLNMKYHKTVQQISGLHGIGLSNIKKAAEKYDGAVAWEAADHVFRLSVMLKNKS